jgi:hypothetical protein
LDLVAESFAAEGFRVVPDGAGVEAAGEGVSDATGERLGLQGVDQETGLAVADGFTRTAAPEGDDRASTGLRFEGDDPEVFLAGKQDDSGSAIHHAHVVVGKSSKELC